MKQYKNIHCSSAGMNNQYPQYGMQNNIMQPYQQNYPQNYSQNYPQNYGTGFGQPTMASTYPWATQFNESIGIPIGAPTGIPTGPTMSVPVTGMPTLVEEAADTSIPGIFDAGIISQTVLSTQYTQGYLRTQIGRKVKVEFLIGTSMLIDREGTLTDVGASYIIIRETETDDLLLCDMYSIKFVKFFF